MSINVQNNNQATIVINNSENINLNVNNSKEATSYIEVNNSKNNNISVNNEKEYQESFSLSLLIPLLICGIILFILKPKKEYLLSIDKEPKKKETEIDDFFKLKEELNFIISKKFVSKNVIDRINSTIKEIENKYYENLEFLKNIKDQEKLKNENEIILKRMRTLIDEIVDLHLNKNALNLENIDNLFSFISTIENAKK